MLNHLLALTTHVIDIGLFTTMLRGFEEREKLINYIEFVSGSRLHNGVSAISEVRMSGLGLVVLYYLVCFILHVVFGLVVMVYVLCGV